MKSIFNEPRTIKSGVDEKSRKAQKLEPAKKSGKDRYLMFGELDDPDEVIEYPRRESILDYFDE